MTIIQHQPMKRLAAAVILVLAFAAPASASTVTRVVDGDSVRVLFYGNPRSVRLYCIDAPERSQPGGAEATAALRSKIDGRTVSIRVIRRDLYRRSVATMRINRRDIALEMVREGHAWVYRTLCADPRFAAAEDKARADRVGLWADPAAINPSDWRKGVR